MFCGFLCDLVNSCMKIITETYFKTWIWQCPVQMLMIYFGPSTLDRKFLLLTVWDWMPSWAGFGECEMERWLLASVDSKQGLGNFPGVNS